MPHKASMRNSFLFSLAIGILTLCAGCQDQPPMGPVQNIRGFSTYQLAAASIIQESDCCILLAVDGHPIHAPHKDENDKYICRQFAVPHGTHTLTVRYFHQYEQFDPTASASVGGLGLSVPVYVSIDDKEDGVHMGPAQFPVNMAPNGIYTIQPNVTGISDVLFAHWQPELIDTQSDQSAGKSALQ
jgi:hypothetical protein